MKEFINLDVNIKENFERDGFLKIDRFFSDSECDALRIRILELISRNEDGSKSIFQTNKSTHTNDEYFLNSGDKIRFFYEKNYSKHLSESGLGKARLINKVGHALHDLDPVFKRFSRTQKLKDLCFALGLKRALLVQSMYIFKQPYIGGEVDCHQDGTFLACNPDTMIGLWIALEDANIENGCLWAIPEGHKGPLRSRFRREGETTEFTELDPTPFDTDKMIPLEIKKGGLIVLHSRLPHLSHKNQSGKSRHAYTLHIMDAKSKFLSDNWLRRNPDFPFTDFDNCKQ